jgi:hypothetical protein
LTTVLPPLRHLRAARPLPAVRAADAQGFGRFRRAAALERADHGGPGAPAQSQPHRARHHPPDLARSAHPLRGQLRGRRLPRARQERITGDTIEASTDAAAPEYVNDSRGVRFDRGHLTVSKIYGWFEEDFGSSAAGVLAHVRRYAAPPQAARLERHSRIDDYAYDWSLNDAGRARREAASAASR